jgi:stage II sporulation protein D
VIFPVLRRVLLICAFCALAATGAASAVLAGGFSAVTATVTVTTATALTTTAPTTTRPTTTGIGTASIDTTTVESPSTTTVATTTTSTAPTTVVLNGHGWGHGLGMSQWGAYGYALHGWTYRAILAHYYTGTTLAPRPAPEIRVLLLDGQKQVVLDSAAAWSVTDNAGTREPLPAGKLTLGPDLTVNGQVLVSPLTFTAGHAPLELGATPYRGKFVVTSLNSQLEVVNELSLEAYLRGVVPSEMPANWPAQALEAQAVAARTYALASLTNVVTAGTFDLYSDQRSQVYGGIEAETPATSAAVTATAHEAVLSDGKVATTYFFSSSGGRTASAAEELGTPIPYLVSVPDPYDTLAPHHNWGPVLFSATQVAKAIKLPGTLLDLLPVDDPSDARAHTVVATGSTGQLVVSGPAFRDDLGLRSTWLTIGWLALTPQPAELLFGTTTAITGLVRGLAGVVLEEKPRGFGWETVSAVTPDPTGAFSTAVTPRATTEFRLSEGTVHAGLITVTVVPLVQAALGGGGVEGTVHPAAAGSPVQLQFRNGVKWSNLASGVTDAAGAFQIPARLDPGTYRVRCPAGAGLSPGLSGTLTVS